MKNELSTIVTRNLVKPSTDTSYLNDNQLKILELSLNKDASVPIFKMKYFIGHSMINTYAILKQYLLELKAREETLESLHFALSKMNIEIEIQTEKLASDELTVAMKKLVQLEIDRFKHEVTKVERNLQDVYVERNKFLALIEEINNSTDGKLPDGRLLFEAMADPIASEAFEKEHWTIRMAKQAGMDILAYGRIGSGNMESITMMPPDQQAEVLLIASEYANKMETHYGLIRNLAIKNSETENNNVMQIPSFAKVAEKNNVSGIPTALLINNTTHIEEKVVNVHNL